MYERIYWPVDPLNPAPLPTPLVKILNGSGAHLRVVSVLEPLAIPDYHPAQDPHTLQLLRLRNTDLRKTLKDFARPAKALGVEADVAVAEGSPLETILTDVRASRSDLLLIRTRATGENGKRIGGLTYDLLLRSPVPVCCYRKVAPDFALRRIVVATDLSEKAYSALQAAIALAKRQGASVTLLHVIPTQGFTLPDATRKRLYDSARTALERWRGARADFAAAGIAIEDVIEDGAEPAEGIIDAVKRHGGDLVVIASQGWTGIPGVFFGSTARKVVRYADMPVLVTRD